MADAGSVGGILAVSVGVNALSAQRKAGGEAAFKSVFAGVAFFGAVAAIGQFISWDLATAIAVVHLLGSMLSNGSGFIEWFIKLMEGI